MSIGDWKAFGEVAGNIDSGLNGLGCDILGDTLQKASAAINLSAGIAEIAMLAVSVMQKDNAEKTAEAVTAASVMSLVPGYGQTAVALAGVSMAVVGATVGALLTYNLRADLSTPSGVTALGQELGAVI